MWLRVILSALIFIAVIIVIVCTEIKAQNAYKQICEAFDSIMEVIERLEEERNSENGKQD